MPWQSEKSISAAVEAVNDLYHRLVIVVGPAGAGKTKLLREAAEAQQSPIINLNLSLTRSLLELTSTQRALRIPVLVEEILQRSGGSPVFVDNIEVLFDVQLKQDPLRLLCSISRNRTVVTSWSGTFVSERLTYAEPGHPEHRVYQAVDALVVPVNTTHR